jgi:hypothetical protein
MIQSNSTHTSNTMDVSISDVLSGTPKWVFVLFAYLVWVGASRLKPGVRELAKIGITPGIFIVWGLIGLFQRPGDFSQVLAHWAIGALVGGALGLALAIPMQADRARRLVLLPGSPLPLLRILVIFGVHYVLRVAAAIHSDVSATYLTWDLYVSGAAAGYFIGWSVRFIQSYRRAPQVDLGAREKPVMDIPRA